MSKRTAGLFLIAVLIFGFLYLRKNSETPPAPAAFIPKEDEPAPIPVPEPVPVKEAPPAGTAESAVTPEALPPLDEKEVAKKRSIAKVYLSSGYTASKAFHAEFGRYSTDLKALGWQPFESWMESKFGFVGAFQPRDVVNTGSITEDPRRMDSDLFLQERNYENEAYAYRGPAGGVRLSDYEKFCSAGCTANESGFEIMVVVPLDESGRIDVWTINEKKEMKMVQDGTKTL